MEKVNKFRKVMEEGKVAVGTCLDSYSAAAVETAGYSGLDFCRIDNEHAWRQDESTENVIRGALLSGIVPLLRIDRDDPYLVRKALEAGAGGIIVPHVHSREEVEEIVKAAKFPPLGTRGYGGLCLSGQWGANAGVEWLEWSNAETLIIPMIEDVAAIPNLNAIMSTEGLDGVFFGPADFSISAGIPLQTGHEKVINALRKTVEIANKYGKFVIFGAGFPQWETVRKVRDLGVKAIELGHDVSILRAVWSRTIQEMRKDS